MNQAARMPVILFSWIRLWLPHKCRQWSDKATMFAVWHLIPYRIRYWSVIRAWADATQGEYSNQEAPAVTVADALKRMR